MYVFQVLFVICAFGSGAYVTALIASRGFDAQAQDVALLVSGVAFVVTSVLAAEALGRLRIDLRLVIIVGTLGFCLARGTMYVAPLPLAAIIGLLGVASLCDGAVAVAMRSLIASYDVRDRTLSMVFFAACDSFGQAVGGVGAGIAIALGGYLRLMRAHRMGGCLHARARGVEDFREVGLHCFAARRRQRPPGQGLRSRDAPLPAAGRSLVRAPSR
jgi:predicted MFS family arabinose efflux permease